MRVAAEAPGVVLLRVQDPAAGAHPLGQARVDHAGVPLGVLVDEGAFQHPGHDLHVAVRVGVEAEPRHDAVVVAHQQQAVVRVGRVVVIAKAEAVLRVEPTGLRAEAVVGAADVHLGFERERHVSV